MDYVFSASFSSLMAFLIEFPIDSSYFDMFLRSSWHLSCRVYTKLLVLFCLTSFEKFWSYFYYFESWRICSSFLGGYGEWGFDSCNAGRSFCSTASSSSYEGYSLFVNQKILCWGNSFITFFNLIVGFSNYTQRLFYICIGKLICILGLSKFL